MNLIKLSGCITALITPFDEEMEVDYDGLKRNVEFQINNGVSGLVPLGTTGEAPTISEEERREIISTVVKQVNGRVPVIVGTGTNSTKHTVEQTVEAQELGADAALIVTPYYNKPTQEGIYRHFKAVSEKSSLPIVVYNIAGRTGVNIETQTLKRISELNNVIGVKEASGNVGQMMEVINELPNSFIVLSGDDNLTLPLVSLGGKGVISVVSNLLPKRVSRMVELALSERIAEAREIHYQLLPIFRTAFIETNPIPIKTAMNLVGMPAGKCRLPLCEMSEANKEKLKKVLSQYEEINAFSRQEK